MKGLTPEFPTLIRGLIVDWSTHLLTYSPYLCSSLGQTDNKDVHTEFHNQVYIMRSIAIMFYASTQLRTYGRHLSSSLGQTDRIDVYTEFYDEVYKIRGIWIIFYRSTQLRTPKNISIRPICCAESSLHLLIYWRHMTKDGISRYCHIAKKTSSQGYLTLPVLSSDS